jgi:ankyrin repeat protein
LSQISERIYLENLQEPFFEAIKAGDQTRVAGLLEQEPRLAAAKTAGGVSAILLAAYYENHAIASLLAERLGRLDVFEAAAVGSLAGIISLVNEQPELVNAFAEDGFYPLGLAAYFGHPEVVEYLLARGADVRAAARNPQKVTALHAAVAHQHLEIAKALLIHGAEVDARQQSGFTPLFAAAQNGQMEMVRLLLSYGADVNARAEAGQTPLGMALQAGQAEVAAVLREKGAIE